MSNKLKLEESLSALMDNEVDDLELRRILKALPEDADLQRKWESFHLISSAIKQEAHPKASVDILSGIQAELENEPALVARTTLNATFKMGGFIRTLGQGAIAASVALAVLFTANTVTSPATETAIVNNMEFAATSNQNQNQISSSAFESTETVFNGEYTVSEFSRFASFDSSSEKAAQDHLRKAVYQEFDEVSTGLEIQVNYKPESDQ